MMKTYNTLYYLLFVILIMGAFASMAQNAYGLVLMGGVAIAFSILFLVQFVESFNSPKQGDVYSTIEFFCLFILSVIFALRIFYINFSYIDIFFAGTCLVLVLIYFRKMLNNFRVYSGRNTTLSFLILAFYLVIVLYFLSLGSISLLPELSLTIGLIAFIFLALLILGGVLAGRPAVDGENTSLFKVVARKRDNAILVLSLFILFTLYRVFSAGSLIPKIYSAEYPQAYFELVNKAESGKEKPVAGKYKYQEFKENYDMFIDQSK
jgi:hypothetical protein